MSDELHRISTKAFLNALGGPPKTRLGRFSTVMRRVMALLRLRSPAPTPRKMLEDYVYGWDANGGAHSNSIGARISQYNRGKPQQPILSVYGAGYFLNTPELNTMAIRGHSRNHTRLQEASQ